MASGEIFTPITNYCETTQIVDFDTENEFFTYVNFGQSTGTKPPTTGNGFLITFVRDTENTKIQFYFSTTDNNQRIWYRLKFMSWGNWRYIVPIEPV